MLEFCDARMWLGEEHIGHAHLTAVLSNPVLVLEDDVAGAKWRHAGYFGMHGVQLHLSTKLWEIFGDLGPQESKEYFAVENHLQMRGHCAIAFQFKSLVTLFKMDGAEKKIRRKRKDVQKKRLKRIR